MSVICKDSVEDRYHVRNCVKEELGTWWTVLMSLSVKYLMYTFCVIHCGGV